MPASSTASYFLFHIGRKAACGLSDCGLSGHISVLSEGELRESNVGVIGPSSGFLLPLSPFQSSNESVCHQASDPLPIMFINVS